MSKKMMLFLIAKIIFFSVFEPTRICKKIIAGDPGFFKPEIHKTLKFQLSELKKGNQLLKELEEFKNIPNLYYNKIKLFLQKIIAFFEVK